MKKGILLAILPLFLVCEWASAASLTVVSPNGGERLPSPSTYQIRWDSTGLSGKQVKLILYKNDAVAGTIKSNIPVDSSPYAWAVGKLENGQSVPYRRRLQDWGGAWVHP